jgi:hypothetical protein
MSIIFRAAARIGESLARAASTLKDAWLASAMPRSPIRYRPEAHYMRGPGPKWFAKHAQASVEDFDRL